MPATPTAAAIPEMLKACLMVAVLGPNGVGKTTLLDIAGDLPAYRLEGLSRGESASAALHATRNLDQRRERAGGRPSA